MSTRTHGRRGMFHWIEDGSSVLPQEREREFRSNRDTGRNRLPCDRFHYVRPETFHDAWLWIIGRRRPREADDDKLLRVRSNNLPLSLCRTSGDTGPGVARSIHSFGWDPISRYSVGTVTGVSSRYGRIWPSWWMIKCLRVRFFTNKRIRRFKTPLNNVSFSTNYLVYMKL